MDIGSKFISSLFSSHITRLTTIFSNPIQGSITFSVLKTTLKRMATQGLKKGQFFHLFKMMAPAEHKLYGIPGFLMIHKQSPYPFTALLTVFVAALTIKVHIFASYNSND